MKILNDVTPCLSISHLADAGLQHADVLVDQAGCFEATAGRSVAAAWEGNLVGQPQRRKQAAAAPTTPGVQPCDR
jgi:hypothetical protein